MDFIALDKPAEPDIDIVARLYDVAAKARAFLEPRWPALQEAHIKAWNWTARARMASEGTCQPSSAFLQLLLKDEGITSKRRSGSALDERGYDIVFEWRNHAWLEAEGYIVDITLDQFNTDHYNNADPVTVLPANHGRYRHSPIIFTLDDIAHDHVRNWRREWISAALKANLTSVNPMQVALGLDKLRA